MLTLFFISLPEKKKLATSLGPSTEGNSITYDAVSTALRDLGVENYEDVLKECKETIEENKDTLKNRYLHSEEEASLITTYTYGKNPEDEDTPYRKLNRMLWDDKAQEQERNSGSYLRMLLRVLRKLSRTRP